MRNRRNKAFTLVEILIVVVILGILAAIVIPQFTNASEEAQIGNVETQLQTLRSQIELYRVRNNGRHPFQDAAGAAVLDWSNMTAPPLGEEAYIRLGDEPVNPRSRASTIADGDAPAEDDADGWLWDAATGTLRACRFDEATRTWLDAD